MRLPIICCALFRCFDVNIVRMIVVSLRFTISAEFQWHVITVDSNVLQWAWPL